MRKVLILFVLGVAAADDGLPALVRVDADADGFISKKEWQAFFKRADQNHDGMLEADELYAAVRGIKLDGQGPAVGEFGPSVRVRSSAGEMVDLFDLRRKTVLVFGAWT